MIELTVAALVIAAVGFFVVLGLIALVFRLFFGLIVLLPFVLLLGIPLLLLIGLSMALVHLLPLLLLIAVVVWAVRGRNNTPRLAPQPR